MVLFLAKNPAVDNFKLSSLQTLVSAAAPLGMALTQELENRLSVNLLQGRNNKYASLLYSRFCMFEILFMTETL